MLKASDLKVGQAIVYQGGNYQLDKTTLEGQLLWVTHFSAPETVVTRNLRGHAIALSTDNKLKCFKLYGGITEIE